MDSQEVHRLREGTRSGVAVLVFQNQDSHLCASPCRSSRHKKAVPSAAGNRMSKSSACSELFVLISTMMPFFAVLRSSEVHAENCRAESVQMGLGWLHAGIASAQLFMDAVFCGIPHPGLSGPFSLICMASAACCDLQSGVINLVACHLAEHGG